MRLQQLRLDRRGFDVCGWRCREAANASAVEAPRYQLLPAIGGPGGQNFSNYCYQYTYLAGVEVRVGDDVDAIRPICREALPGGGPGSFRTGLPFYGGNGGELHVLQCPDVQPFVRSLWVRAEGHLQRLVNNVSIVCAGISESWSTPVKGYNFFTVGGVFYPLPGSYEEKSYTCPEGMAFAGLHGRAGQMLDALGAACKTIETRPDAQPTPPVADQRWVSPTHGGSGGEAFTSACPANQYLVGLRVREGRDIDAIAPICAAALTGGKRGAVSFLPLAGGGGGQEVEFQCPSSVPFIRAMNLETGGAATRVLTYLTVLCGPFSGPVDSASNSSHMAFSRPQIGENVDRRYIDSLRRVEMRCPDGMMYSGLHGRAGHLVDALGIICTRAVTSLSGIGKKGRGTIKEAADNEILQSPGLQPAAPVGTAANLPAIAEATGIRTTEMICRGGPELRVENKGVKDTAEGGRTVVFHIFFGLNFSARNAAGNFAPAGNEGQGLQPGTCSFRDQWFTANDPQAIVFDVVPVGGESEAKRMLHEAQPGGTPNPLKAAEERPNEQTIPLYLSVPDHYWSFDVQRTNYGHFVATAHRPWKPRSTTQIIETAKPRPGLPEIRPKSP